MFFPINWDASICPWHRCVQDPRTPRCHGRVQGHLRPLRRGLAIGGAGAPVQQEVEDGGCNHSTIERHIPIAWEELIDSGHLKTSPTPVPTFALVEIGIWCERHVVDSEKRSTTDPGWRAALLTCSEEVSSSPFHILGPRPEYRSEQWDRLAGEQGGWVRAQRGNPQGPVPVRVIIDPGYGGNVVNVFHNSGSKTSSLSVEREEGRQGGDNRPLLWSSLTLCVARVWFR